MRNLLRTFLVVLAVMQLWGCANVRSQFFPTSHSGVVINKVTLESPAASMGITQGDRIIEVSQKDVTTPEHVKYYFDEARKRGEKHVLLLLEGRTELRFISLKIGPDLSGLVFENQIDTATTSVSKPQIGSSQSPNPTLPRMDFQRGMDAYNRGNYATALKEWMPLAEKGDAEAQYNLGFMYSKGQGVSQDHKEAVKWFRLAAKQGDSIAQHQLGVMYRDGQGVSQNYIEAIKWFRLAAEQGDSWGQHDLGAMYSLGQGVPQDQKEANKWIRLAAEQGLKYSQYELGFSYEFGIDVPQDSTEAAKWYHRAAKQSYDHASAIKWFRESAEDGDRAGQYAIGKFYEIGRVVSQDYAEALKWYRLAANQGDAYAKKELTTLEGQKTQTAGLPSALAKDTTPPTIAIATAITVKTDSPTIRGRVMDNTRVSQVTVNGVVADFENGNFSFTRYVPSSGTTVLIEAIDEWGNRSQKTVRLTRSSVQTASVSFAALNPTGFSSKTNKDAVVLIIGIADYKRTPQAKYADRDAEFFSDYARRKLGVPDRNIKVLTNEAADITDIIEAANVWLPRATKANLSDVYLFFAGHGLGSDDGDELYLLPYNGIPQLLDRTSILRSDLFKSIAATKPRSVTAFLDTCYSGTSRTEETLLASRPVLLAAKHQDVPAGFTLISAAGMDQTAKLLPEAEHGLFSYWLMKGMEGPADANGDRSITAGELHSYVLAAVSRIQRNQTPELQGDAERVLVRW